MPGSADVDGVARIDAHERKVARASAGVGDQDQLRAIDAALLVIAGGRRLGKEMDLLETGLAQYNREVHQG